MPASRGARSWVSRWAAIGLVFKESRRHHAINWKTFVEMKATGRGPQSSIEMSNAEFKRAKERGMDFILALVSGLELGQKDKVRLILDPANRLPIRPMNGVRLGGLPEAPCIIVRFEDADGAEPGLTAAAS